MMPIVSNDFVNVVQDYFPYDEVQDQIFVTAHREHCDRYASTQVMERAYYCHKHEAETALVVDVGDKAILLRLILPTSHVDVQVVRDHRGRKHRRNRADSDGKERVRTDLLRIVQPDVNM